MADPSNIAGLALASLHALKSLIDSFTVIAKQDPALDSLLEDMQSSYEKSEIIALTWSYNESKNHEMTPDQILWNEQFCIRVQQVFADSLKAIRDIENEISAMKPGPPRNFFRRCFAWLHKSSSKVDSTTLETLNELVAHLCNLVEEAWAYYHAATEAQDLASSQMDGSIDKLPDDDCARQAKEAGLALFDICCTTNAECNIDLNLLGRSQAYSEECTRKSLPQLSYHLFLTSSKTPEKVKEISITGVAASEASDLSGLQKGSMSENVATQLGFVYVNGPEDSIPVEKEYTPTLDLLHQFLDSPQDKTFEVSQSGINEPVYLKITKALMLVTPSPQLTPLVKLFAPQKSPKPLVPTNNLSLMDRIELAYEVVQYGFYTLGTPWASFLKLKNLYKIGSNSQSSRFILSIREADSSSIKSDNPEILAETSHILQIGTLLVEIALQEAFSTEQDVQQTWFDRVKTLGQVERAMGSEYCKAVAFCLQPRYAQVQSQKREKFDYSMNQSWRNYSSEILGEYREYVLKKIHRLHKIVGA